MKTMIAVARSRDAAREVCVSIDNDEMARIHLYVPGAPVANRSDGYLRRHRLESEKHLEERASPSPNSPLAPLSRIRFSIPEQIDQMRQRGLLSRPSAAVSDGTDSYCQEPTMLAVPISDISANLLRPAFHRGGFGEFNVLYFAGEPITERSYFCLCAFESGRRPIAFKRVRFDPVRDCVLDAESGRIVEGLNWSAALVPLVEGGRALSAVAIAQHDYDLRQIVGRDNLQLISRAYDGWYGDWDNRVRTVVEEHIETRKPFAHFYHSIFCMDAEGNVQIRQLAGALPDLAESLARQGIVSAGLLDSGGSCALYDVWLKSFLNRCWYYRELRGAILVIELTTLERLPVGTPAHSGRSIKDV